MAAKPRSHVLKLRLSEAELEDVRARAGDEPAAVWLRRLALDAPPPKRRRQVRERPLNPAASELIHAAARSCTYLGEIREAVSAAPLTAAGADSLCQSLDRIEAYLGRYLELAQC